MVKEKPSQEEPKNPPAHLPPEFYQKLLRIPPCRRGEPCNHCGQCEH